MRPLRPKKYYIKNCDYIHNDTRQCMSRFVVLVIIIVISLSGISDLFAQSESKLAVPAIFIRELQLPGTNNHFLRPARILADNEHNEIYVCDMGNSRILIFANNGFLKYEFSVSDYCGAPSDVAVDKSGYIYVLGSTKAGNQIFVFDYDGEFKNYLQIRSENEESGLNIQSISIDENNNLIILDGIANELLCCTTDGLIFNRFPVIRGEENDFIREKVLGSIAVKNSIIYVPISSLGTVYRFKTDGSQLGFVGQQGQTPGKLNFPVSVTVTNDGIILVLDKHRYNVVCFSENGSFLGEFGGKGNNPGWFYHPIFLAVDNQNHTYIGQIYNNKIQVCDFPEFIRERNNQIPDLSKNSQSDKTISNRLSDLTFKQSTHEGGIQLPRETIVFKSLLKNKSDNSIEFSLQTNWRFLTCVS